MTALTFITGRDGKLRTSDLSEFRAQVRSALLGSYTGEHTFIHEHFGDIRFNQTYSDEDPTTPLLVITLTAGTREAQRLIDWIELSLEERFLFQGRYVERVRS